MEGYKNIMNKIKVMAMLNEEIINRMRDQSAANVLRSILFDANNRIDWNQAYLLTMSFMPELQVEEKYKIENMR